jgi:hypothetical protein
MDSFFRAKHDAGQKPSNPLTELLSGAGQQVHKLEIRKKALTTKIGLIEEKKRINEERIAALLDKNLSLQEDFKKLVEQEAAAKLRNHELEVTLQRQAHDQGRQKAHCAMVQRNVEAAGRQLVAQESDAVNRFASLTKVICQMRTVRVQVKHATVRKQQDIELAAIMIHCRQSKLRQLEACLQSILTEAKKDKNLAPLVAEFLARGQVSYK